MTDLIMLDVEDEDPEPCPVCDGRGFNDEYDAVVGRLLPWPCAACRQTGVAR